MSVEERKANLLGRFNEVHRRRPTAEEMFMLNFLADVGPIYDSNFEKLQEASSKVRKGDLNPAGARLRKEWSLKLTRYRDIEDKINRISWLCRDMLGIQSVPLKDKKYKYQRKTQTIGGK